MKTNPILLFSTVLFISTSILSANDNLCGGADDDQFFDDASLCGGADDDQFQPIEHGLVSDTLGVAATTVQPPVLQGITSDPLGIRPPLAAPITAPNADSVMAMWSQLVGTNPPAICGGNGNDSLLPIPPAICGGNGNDSLVPVVLAICGGNGNDSLNPVPLSDQVILALLAGDSLTGDSMDDDDLVGGDAAGQSAGDPDN